MSELGECNAVNFPAGSYIGQNLKNADKAENLAQKLFEVIKESEPDIYSSSVAIKAVKLLAFRFDLFRL